MQRRLSTTLCVWGALLFVEGACARIGNSNQHARGAEPANLPGTQEENKSVPHQAHLDELSIVRETDFGPVKPVQWRDKDNILAFFDIPYGAFEKPFAVSITNIDTRQYVSRRTENKTVYYKI